MIHSHAAAGPVISELLALNTGGLLDRDGEASDWVEIHNPDAVPVNLGGWALTDDLSSPFPWTFPPVELAPGGFLVVFASGKDRTDPAGELHTSFRLEGGGEPLALLRPDGSTAHAFTPRYPSQRDGISYGLSMEGTALVAPGAAVDLRVPADGGLGTAWISPDFNPDASWVRGTTGVGYSTASGSLPPPLSHYAFDGSVEDSAGPNEGSYEGDPDPVFVDGHDGRPGGALEFRGGQWVEVFHGAGLPLYSRPASTVAMWVNGLPQPDRRVFSQGSSTNNSPLFTIGTDPGGASGRADIFVRSDSGAAIVNHRLSAGVVFDGTWHHLAWVDEGGQAALYIDGVLDPVDFDYAKPSLSLNVTSFGAVLRASACCFFTGAIDEAALWDRALAPEEIAALAAGGSPLGDLLYRGLIGADVEEAMAGQRPGIYLRIPFQVSDPAAFDSLTLRLRYEDGFVAYLNGVEAARRNAPAPVVWSSAATAARTPAEAMTPQDHDLTPLLDLLRPGANVLAIHGLNRTAADEGFLVLPELLATALLGEPRFFSLPTPGSTNRGGAVDFVADTRFSHDRGFYDAAFLLEISTATPGASIRYTTDFSEPTETRGQVYAGPISITRTTVVRAAAFQAGWQPSDVDTQTYIFPEGVIRQAAVQPGLPTTWQTGYSADYEMDPEICVQTGSPWYESTVKEDLKAIPTISLVLEADGLFGPVNGIYNHSENGGLAWERRASMELFTADGKTDEQVTCGLRMQGGASRFPDRQPKHSFRLLFKDIHGPGKLRHRLFQDCEDLGGASVDEYNTIILRCFFTDGWSTRYQEPRYRPDDSQYIRDVWMKDSLGDMGQPTTHGAYAHVYINGLYWGLYNTTERPDASHQSIHSGGEREDWDIVKDFSELMEGQKTDWNRMQALASAGLSSNAAYMAIQGLRPDGTDDPALPSYVEVDNLIDYFILHIFAGAEDWPHHNWYAARNRNDPSTGFRFFSWDQEIVLDTLDRNRIDVSNADTPASVYARLRENAEFRLRFADRAQMHLRNGGALSVEACAARWMERAEEIHDALTGESARWGDVRRSVPFTRDVEWLAEQRVVIDEYLPAIHPRTLDRFRAAGLFPALEPPSFNRHGGRIASSFRLSMAAPAGTVLYTLDGSDPRLSGGAVSPSARTWTGGGGGATELLGQGSAARFLVPADGALGTGWTARVFDHAAWASGTLGVGFETFPSDYDPLIGADAGSMYQENASVYVRIPFRVDDPSALGSLVLRMKYEDGFIAYLNGAKVAERNAPASPQWNSGSTAPRADADALVFQDFDITSRLGLLVAGENVLALHGLNFGVDSNDLLLLPALEADGGAAGGLALPEATEVSARALQGGQWSALNRALFFPDIPLRLTEIMYHPPDPEPGSSFDADSFEFLELQNVGSATLDLSGMRLAGAVEFDFSAGAVRRLLPGDLVLVVEDLEAFRIRYGTVGLRIAGQYTGSLDNLSEAVRLHGPAGETLLEVRYRDHWEPSTDGGGRSLVIADPLGDPERWGDAASWVESGFEGGSPGVDETGGPPQGGLQLPGDSSGDGRLDLADAVSILLRLYQGDAAPPPPCAGGLSSEANLAVLDLDGDGLLGIEDPIHCLSFLYRGGPPPAGGLFCVRVVDCADACSE